MIKKKRALTATLVTLGLFVASCGGDDAAEPAAEAPAEEEAAEAPAEEEAAEVSATPGEGVSVTMAKADWSTEDPNAYVAHLLLAELG